MLAGKLASLIIQTVVGTWKDDLPQSDYKHMHPAHLEQWIQAAGAEIVRKHMDAFVLQHIFLDKAKRSQEQNKEEYRVLQTFKWQAWVLACRVRDTLNAMHMRSSEQEDDKKEKDEPLPKNILLKNPGHFLSVNVLPQLVWKCKRGDGGDMVDFLNEHDSLVSLIKDKKKQQTMTTQGEQTHFMRDQSNQNIALIDEWFTVPTHATLLFDALVSEQIMDEILTTFDKNERRFRGVTILFPSTFALCRYLTTRVVQEGDTPIFLLLSVNDLKRYEPTYPKTVSLTFTDPTITVLFVATRLNVSMVTASGNDAVHSYCATALPLTEEYANRLKLYRTQHHIYCLSCGRSQAAFKCTRCKQAQYCSRDCQKVHWGLHKRICTA